MTTSDIRPVVVGDLQLTIDGIDLRDIRWRGEECVRRIYPVFQDRNWTNRLFVITERDIDESGDVVRLTAAGHGSFDATLLRWRVDATITDIDIDYRFHAETDVPFWRNRLGMCVLHPMELSGKRCEVTHVDGSLTESEFPDSISPFQPFIDMRSIRHRTSDDSVVSVELLGETYEMEDHRNWSDASYKTYCTPITLPFPVEVTPGTPIDQQIRVSVEPHHTTPSSEPDIAVRVNIFEDRTDLPKLGTYVTDLDLDEDTIESLCALKLDHIRVDIDATTPDALRRLEASADLARQVDARLHVAAFCKNPEDLAVVTQAPKQVFDAIDAWFVFSTEHKVTPDSWSAPARAALSDAPESALIVGGTDLYFTELNREPPDSSSFDGFNFSINPQVHAFDDRTLIQNTQTQAVIASNAPRITGSAEIYVSPITLKPRFNPNATDPSTDVSNTDLPANVDERQNSELAAMWLLSSLKYLATPGTIASASYFEACGWRGLCAGPGGSPDPSHFAAAPGERFPAWQALADIAGARSARRCVASHPEIADALVVEDENGTRALVWNWTDAEQEVDVRSVVEAHVLVPPRSYVVVDL